MKMLPTVLTLALILMGCSSDSMIGPSLGAIQGVVKDPRTMSPLQNVQVYSIPGTGLAVTGEGGVYLIENVVPGEYIVKAHYSDSVFVGYATMPVRVHSSTTTTADMVLRSGSAGKGVISGRVVDERGSPVAGAMVTTFPKTTTEVTTQDGYFLLTDVINDSLLINVSNDVLFGKSRVHAELDVITKVTITTYPQDPSKGSITGKVTSRGEPVSEAIVHIDALGLIDTTDERGMYLLRNVPEGQHRMSVDRNGLQSRTFLVDAIPDVPTVKDVSLGLSSMLPLANLEIYLPLDGSIEDRSPNYRPTREIGKDLRFVPDRFGRPNEAVQLTGWDGISTVDGARMNYKPVTMGMWLKIPATNTSVNLVFGKTPHPMGDGYYVVLENNRLVFIWVTNSWGQISRTEIAAGAIPRDRWFWIGFAVGNDGTGYATMNGITTMSIPLASNPITNQEQFTFGNLPSTTIHPGLIGQMDQVVVYSTYKTIDELKRIMDTKD
jgi:hypothetical protein